MGLRTAVERTGAAIDHVSIRCTRMNHRVMGDHQRVLQVVRHQSQINQLGSKKRRNSRRKGRRRRLHEGGAEESPSKLQLRRHPRLSSSEASRLLRAFRATGRRGLTSRYGRATESKCDRTVALHLYVKTASGLVTF